METRHPLTEAAKSITAAADIARDRGEETTVAEIALKAARAGTPLDKVGLDNARTALKVAAEKKIGQRPKWNKHVQATKPR